MDDAWDNKEVEAAGKATAERGAEDDDDDKTPRNNTRH
jgi:hypothetical protein